MAFCRDCFSDLANDISACAACGSRRVCSHPELDSLHIAHVDCDAFYASVEKRDRPELAGKPVIVGGRSRRAVVLTACYVARKFGVKSAMPMYQALKLCPEGVIVPPDMRKYAEVAGDVRRLLWSATPIIETVSLDEAYLDLSGTERLHRMIPAKTLARLAAQVAREIGITLSVGLSCNKFLAKLASDLDKPSGFAVIGRSEAKAFLATRPVGMLRGVGPALQTRLAREGFSTVGDLQSAGLDDLARRFGDSGTWLFRMANGEDHSVVQYNRETKSISSETTFETDIAGFPQLEAELWRQCERVSERAKSSHLGGRTVVLKLKTKAFRIRTRSMTLDEPTQLSAVIFEAGRLLLNREANGDEFRLLGIGLSQLHPDDACDTAQRLDRRRTKRAEVERAMDRVRAKFGAEAIVKGRSL